MIKYSKADVSCYKGVISTKLSEKQKSYHKERWPMNEAIKTITRSLGLKDLFHCSSKRPK